VKKPNAIMYHCARCGRPISATPGDAVHMITGGPHCTECLRDAAVASMAAPTRQPSAGRASAAKARWAAMTAEQKAERVAKLIAGRKAQASGDVEDQRRAAFVKAATAPIGSEVAVQTTGRGAAAKARWEAMSPEQKAERIAKLKAGRKAQAAAGGGS
jgi:DNA-directed RNA polymerase subunit RPC12/RpoP/predicted Fe-S protein YdhL (DUF1289 family)